MRLSPSRAMGRKELHQSGLGRDVVLPSHPGDGEAFVEHEAVAEVFLFTRVVGARGEVELVEGALAAAVDDLVEDGAVAFGGVPGNEQIKVGGKLDTAAVVDRGVVDVGDAAVGVVFGIHLEVDFADEAVVGAGLAEGLAVEDRALFAEFDADDLGGGGAR